MCGPNLKRKGQGVIELLIGNEKVTNGCHLHAPTERHCAKQSALSSLKGAYLTHLNLYEVIMNIHKTRNSLEAMNAPQIPIVYKRQNLLHVYQTLLAHQDMTKKITFMKRIKER